MRSPFKIPVFFYFLTICCLLTLYNCTKEEVAILPEPSQPIVEDRSPIEDYLQANQLLDTQVLNISKSELISETKFPLLDVKGKSNKENPYFVSLDFEDIDELFDRNYQIRLEPIIGNPSLSLYGYDAENSRNKWRKIEVDVVKGKNLNFKRAILRDYEEKVIIAITGNRPTYFKLKVIATETPLTLY